jgi:hypothetical protein
LAEQRAGIRAAQRPSDRDAIVLGDEVVDREAEVGVGAVHGRHDVRRAIRAGRPPRQRVVVEEVGGGERAQALRVACRDHLLEDVADQGLVALRTELAELRVRVGELQASAELLPHRRTYLMLVAAFCATCSSCTRASSTRSSARSTARRGRSAAAQPKNASASA